MRTLRHERGQTLVLTTFFVTALLGMAALVLDVGSWMRAKRDLQAVADAAALAGAQALPDDAARAHALARQYVAKNNGPSNPSVTISRQIVPNDVIFVSVSTQAPGFFSRVLRINSVTVGARAKARSENVTAARYVAPIVVHHRHPMLQCTPPPCETNTSIELAHLHAAGMGGNAAGQFALLDLRRDGNGSPGQDEVASWMMSGFDAYMPLGTYEGTPSAMFNGAAFQEALQARVGTEVLFPVYRPPIRRSGTNAQFTIVGWVGFRITGSEVRGDEGSIYGSFTRYIAEGIQVETGGNPDFGVRAIELID
jgi:hypothetical protein